MQNPVFGAPIEDDTPKGPSRDGSMWWETLGVLAALPALFLFVSLLVGESGASLIGPVGQTTSGALTWLFGAWVAFLIPVFLMWFAIQVFRARVNRWSPKRVIGVCVLIPAITGLLALPQADIVEFRAENFDRAGAIGTFMVEWEGLRLVGSFGMVGAGMILSAMLLIGVGLITDLRLSEMFLRVLNREAPPAPVSEADESEAPVKTRRTRAAAAPTLFGPEPEIAEDEEATDEEPAKGKSRSGLFSIFSGRGKESQLPDPDPEELEDYQDPQPDYYDEDALAAARALEEARIDEEYERALQAEAASSDENEIEFDEEDDDEDSEIVFHDATDPLDVISGNPANEGALGSGLAKLFPSRWSKDGDEVKRRTPGEEDFDEEEAEEDEEDDLLAKAEERAFRRAGGDNDTDFDEDPLFDPTLDTRPAGPLAAAKALAAAEAEERAERNRQLAAYRLPDVQMLEDPPQVDHRMTREEMLEISQLLEKTFADFNIAVKVVEVKQGPVVTRFELKPAPGVKVSRIVSLEHDVALAMKAQSVRIVAPIPGKAAVGIEIPNKRRAGVYLKELVSCTEFWEQTSPLGFALGKTIDGAPYFADLKKMPHLLIAGATGAGKSVCLNTLICSFLYRMRPDRLRLLLVDPKRVEMSIYEGIPHLISPVVCEPKAAAAALQWAVEQMEERYKTLVEYKVRNIDGYNDIALNPEKHPKFATRSIEPMPHLVIVVDELADLMVVAKNEVEESIQRLAQMARAVGIHLVLATQRPSVNVITGIIKANFPTRISFQVRQKVDSRTILDCGGAEALLGRGDMLFAPAGAAKPQRLQGAFLSDEEVERVVDHCRSQAEPMYDVEEFEPVLSEKEQRELARLMGTNIEDMDDLAMQDRVARGTNQTMGKVSAGMFVPHDGGSAQAGDDEIDEALVRAAARVILEGRKGSTSLVQRRLKVGFARAGRLMDMLEEMGIVGAYKGSKPRDLLVDPDLALQQLDALEEQIQRVGNSRDAAAELDGEAG